MNDYAACVDQNKVGCPHLQTDPAYIFYPNLAPCPFFVKADPAWCGQSGLDVSMLSACSLGLWSTEIRNLRRKMLKREEPIDEPDTVDPILNQKIKTQNPNMNLFEIQNV